jgi:hypothetical protein
LRLDSRLRTRNDLFIIFRPVQCPYLKLLRLKRRIPSRNFK